MNTYSIISDGFILDLHNCNRDKACSLLLVVTIGCMSNLNLKKDFLGTAIAIGLAVTACGGGDELIDSNSLSQQTPTSPISNTIGDSNPPELFASLANSSWFFASSGNGLIVPAADDTQFTLQFDFDERQMSGFDGCSSWRTAIELSDAGIGIVGLEVEQSECVLSPVVIDQQQLIYRAITGVLPVSLESGVLQLGTLRFTQNQMLGELDTQTNLESSAIDNSNRLNVRVLRAFPTPQLAINRDFSIFNDTEAFANAYENILTQFDSSLVNNIAAELPSVNFNSEFVVTVSSDGSTPSGSDIDIREAEIINNNLTIKVNSRLIEHCGNFQFGENVHTIFVAVERPPTGIPTDSIRFLEIEEHCDALNQNFGLPLSQVTTPGFTVSELPALAQRVNPETPEDIRSLDLDVRLLENQDVSITWQAPTNKIVDYVSVQGTGGVLRIQNKQQIVVSQLVTGIDYEFVLTPVFEDNTTGYPNRLAFNTDGLVSSTLRSGGLTTLLSATNYALADTTEITAASSEFTDQFAGASALDCSVPIESSAHPFLENSRIDIQCFAAALENGQPVYALELESGLCGTNQAALYAIDENGLTSVFYNRFSEPFFVQRSTTQRIGVADCVQFNSSLAAYRCNELLVSDDAVNCRDVSFAFPDLEAASEQL